MNQLSIRGDSESISTVGEQREVPHFFELEGSVVGVDGMHGRGSGDMVGLVDDDLSITRQS
jgi:hypothetical protein